jgi:hypothetical protein
MASETDIPKSAAYYTEFFGMYPTADKARAYYKSHPHTGAFAQFRKALKDGRLRAEEEEFEHKMDLRFICQDSGLHLRFFSMKNGHLYTFDPSNPVKGGTKFKDEGPYDRVVADYNRQAEESDRRMYDGVNFGDLKESFYSDHPTFTAAKPVLAGAKATMPNDASPQDIDFMRQNDMRVLQDDQYSPIFVSLRDGSVYDYKEGRSNDPTHGTRFRLLGHYDRFVADHCNRVDNGVQKIEETADLITMGLF